jgi:protein O-mannosyl-transferase
LKNKKKKKQKIPVSNGKYNKQIYPLFLVFIPLILYFRVVNFEFTTFDDQEIINNIHSVQGSPLNLYEAFIHDAFMSNTGESFYRPMQTVSFMLDAQLGGKDAWVYHFSNLILHILTVITLFFFLIKIRIKEEISFLLALFFSIHPLFTNAVAWIPARGDILLCLFSLLSFITLLEFFNTREIVYIILHAIVFMAAVFSKEAVIFLPFLILFYLYFAAKKEFVVKEIFPAILIWCLSFVVFYYLRHSVLKTNLS